MLGTFYLHRDHGARDDRQKARLKWLVGAMGVGALTTLKSGGVEAPGERKPAAATPAATPVKADPKAPAAPKADTPKPAAPKADPKAPAKK